MRKTIEGWLRENYPLYSVRSEWSDDPTVITINTMDRISLEIFYEESFIEIILPNIEQHRIYYANPLFFDNLRGAISRVEEATAIKINA